MLWSAKWSEMERHLIHARARNRIHPFLASGGNSRLPAARYRVQLRQPAVPAIFDEYIRPAPDSEPTHTRGRLPVSETRQTPGPSTTHLPMPQYAGEPSPGNNLKTAQALPPWCRDLEAA